MTVKKTDADLAPEVERKGPELIGATRDDETVKALLKSYPHAKMIEKLASGTFAVRFRKKGRPVVYKRVKR